MPKAFGMDTAMFSPSKTGGTRAILHALVLRALRHRLLKYTRCRSELGILHVSRPPSPLLVAVVVVVAVVAVTVAVAVVVVTSHSHPA